jgi:hypothetical protein
VFTIQYTWKVWADDLFLGYEYANDITGALANTKRKHGSPCRWGINEYNLKRIN